MASSKFPGCEIINVESDGGGTVAEEVSRSGIRPYDEEMSVSDCSPPFNQREIGSCFPFLESNSDSGSGSVDSIPDPHNGFIDFFNRESNQSEGSSDYSNLLSFYGMDEDIDLGLGIGSGSGSGPGQLLGEGSDNENKEIESGRVDADTDLTLVGVEDVSSMVADEELEWENLQNAIGWEPEPLFQVSLLGLEEDGYGGDLSNEHDNWQVLLDASIVMEEDEDVAFNGFIDSIEEYIENSGAYDALFVDNNESVIMGSPPASKSVVEELPVVEITSEELRDGNIVCAICKDEVLVEEKVKRLPCRHYYHGECIVPWLGIRNTCPVCRYELPTDDLEYERNRRSQRRGLVTDLMSE